MPPAAAAPPSLPGVRDEYVDVDGLLVHAAVAGPADGPPVVLLHGWPQHWWMWRDVLAGLTAAGHRVVAPDLRGFGWSAAPADGYDKEQLASDVLGALDRLEVGDFALAGHDWGGWTAQLVALREPARVRRLAILNMIPVGAGRRTMVPQLWRYAHVAINSLPVAGRDWQQQPALMERALLGVPQADRPVFAERFTDPVRARAAQRLYRTFLLRELPAILRGRYDGQRLTMPTLVLHGRRDPIIRPAMAEAFRGCADDLTIEYVPEAGHFVADEQPERVRDRLVGWFTA